MKDIIGKSKIISINLPRKLTINKVDVYNKPEIANAFNDFFTDIGQKLASQITKSSKTFKTYINKVNVIILYQILLLKNLTIMKEIGQNLNKKTLYLTIWIKIGLTYSKLINKMLIFPWILF